MKNGIIEHQIWTELALEVQLVSGDDRKCAQNQCSNIHIFMQAIEKKRDVLWFMLKEVLDIHLHNNFYYISITHLTSSGDLPCYVD